GGELRQRQLLRAHVRTQMQSLQGSLNSVMARDKSQIVSQSFVLLTKADSYEFEKPRFVGDIEQGAFAGQGHSYERRCDARRRTKSPWGNAENDFRLCVELAHSRKI